MQRTFEYATVDRWVDGDTISAKIDLGFRINFTEKFRLARINTPEKGQPGYIEAIARVNQLCPVNSTVTITCHGYDRYGRWISDIVNKDGVNVNDVLLQEGLAKPYA